MVKELDEPVDEVEEAAETAEEDGHEGVSVVGILLLGDCAELAESRDEGNNEGAEGDGTEGEGEGAAGGVPSNVGGHAGG